MMRSSPRAWLPLLLTAAVLAACSASHHTVRAPDSGAAVATSAAEPPTAATTAAASAAPGDLSADVDIGGRTLFVTCSGQGTPTVILEAGYSQASASWSLVQPSVAQETRVCAYDRA